MAMMIIFLKLLRVILRITRPYCYYVLDKVHRIIFGPKFTLPPIEDTLLLTPATVLAKRIRERKLKAEDVMNAYIKRMKEINRYINAYVDQRFEEALAEAKEVDVFLSKSIRAKEEIEKDSPLLGLPFTCKEVLGVKGLAQTCGGYSHRNRRAPVDGDCTSLYRKAGAIPVAVTNVAEFCIWWETVNPVFGRTFNPYNNLRCAGGTSGGEAALIGSAGALFGVGNDFAGSSRVPAAFNGIYAHKPTPNLVSNVGFWPELEENFNNYIASGPICRYAQDLPVLSSVLSEGKIDITRKVDFHQIKIYYIETFPGFLFEPTPDVINAVRKAVKYFTETFGSKPTELFIPELKYSSQMFAAKYLELNPSPMRDYLTDSGEDVNLLHEVIKMFLGRGKYCLQTIHAVASDSRTKDSEYYKFLAMFDTVRDTIYRTMGGDFLLLVPTHPEPALHHYTTIPKNANKSYTSIFNLLKYPVTQIPAGLSEGLPIGIQAVSGVNKDHVCIAAAIELEKLFGGWISPCPITAL